jgi:hypothetical protein
MLLFRSRQTQQQKEMQAMKKSLFVERVKERFPERNIKFAFNELMNTANMDGFLFYNIVYSDHIFIQYDGKNFGTME